MSNQFDQTVNKIEQALERLIELAEQTDRNLGELDNRRLNIAKDLTESNNQLERFDQILESLGDKGLKKVRQAVRMVNEAIAGIDAASLEQLNTALERSNRLLTAVENLSNRARSNINNIVAPILTATNQVDDLSEKLNQLGDDGKRAASEIQTAMNSLDFNQVSAGIDSLQASLTNLRTDNIGHIAASVTALQTAINTIDTDKLIKLTNVQAPAAKAVIEEVAQETKPKKKRKPRTPKTEQQQGLTLEEVRSREAKKTAEEPIQPATRTLEEVRTKRQQAEEARKKMYAMRRMIATAFTQQRNRDIGANFDESQIAEIARQLASGQIKRKPNEGASSVGAFSEQFEDLVKNLEQAYYNENQEAIQKIKKQYKISTTSMGAASVIFDTLPGLQPSKIAEYDKEIEDLRKEEEQLRNSGGSRIQSRLVNTTLRDASNQADSIARDDSSVQPVRGIFSTLRDTFNSLTNVSGVTDKITKASDAINTALDSLRNIDLSGIKDLGDMEQHAQQISRGIRELINVNDQIAQLAASNTKEKFNVFDKIAHAFKDAIDSAILTITHGFNELSTALRSLGTYTADDLAGISATILRSAGLMERDTKYHDLEGKQHIEDKKSREELEQGQVQEDNIYISSGKYYRTHGDPYIGADPDEYKTNLAMMEKTVDASPNKMAVFGTVGGPDTGRTPGITLTDKEGKEERVNIDHSFVAYRDGSGKLKVLEIIAIPGGEHLRNQQGHNEEGFTSSDLAGLRMPGARSPEDLAEYAGELVGVPLQMTTEAFEKFAAQFAKAQLPGQSYSFFSDVGTAENIGNSCASGVAEALRKSGTSDYAAPLFGRINMASPGGVLREAAAARDPSREQTEKEQLDEFKNLQDTFVKYTEKLNDTAFYEQKQQELDQLNKVIAQYKHEVLLGMREEDEDYSQSLSKQRTILESYAREPENIVNALEFIRARLETLGSTLGDKVVDTSRISTTVGSIVTGDTDVNDAVRSAYNDLMSGSQPIKDVLQKLSSKLLEHDSSGSVPLALKAVADSYDKSTADLILAIRKLDNSLESYAVESLQKASVGEENVPYSQAVAEQTGELFARLSPAAENQGPLPKILNSYRSFAYATTQVGAILNSISEFLKYVRNINPGTLVDVVSPVVKFVGAIQNISSKYLGIGKGASTRRGRTIVDIADAVGIMWGRQEEKKESPGEAESTSFDNIPEEQRRKIARQAIESAVLNLPTGGARFKGKSYDRNVAVDSLEGLLTTGTPINEDDLRRVWAGSNSGNVDVAAMRDLLQATYNSLINAATSVEEAGESAKEANESRINALLSPEAKVKDAGQERVRKLLQNLPEDDLRTVKQVEKSITRLSKALHDRTGGNYVLASDDSIRQLIHTTSSKENYKKYDSLLRQGRLQGANIQLAPDEKGAKGQLQFSVMSNPNVRKEAGSTILHELTHNIVNSYVESAGKDDNSQENKLMRSFADYTRSTKSKREGTLKSLDFSDDELDYLFSPDEVLAHVGEAFLTGNKKLEDRFKKLYGQDLWDGAIATLKKIAPDVYDTGANEIRSGFADFDSEIKNIIDQSGNRQSILDVIKAFISNTFENIKSAFTGMGLEGLLMPQMEQAEVEQAATVSARLSSASSSSKNDVIARAMEKAAQSFATTGSKLQSLTVRAVLDNDIKTALRDALEKPSTDTLSQLKDVGLGFLQQQVVGEPSLTNQLLGRIAPIRDTYIEGMSFNTGRALAERFGMQPNLENQYFENFNTAFKSRTGESLQRRDFQIQETFDWDTGTTKLAASAKTASGAITQLTAEIDQLGNVSVETPKSGFGEAMNRIRSEIVQEIPEEIIEEFIYGIISSAQELFSAIIDLQDEIAEIEILMEDSVGGDLSIDIGKMSSAFTIAAIEMAAATGQGFEEALKTNIQNFKVLANVDPITDQTRIAQQLSQTQLGSQTVFGLTLDQSLESLPAIYAQMRDMIKDTDLSAAERAQQAADGLDSLMDKFVVARRETGAAGDELVQIYARLASSASDIGLDPDKLIALSASASVALGKSADETASSLKFFIERTYSQEGIKALNDYGIAVQKIGEDGIPTMRSLDDIIDDINTKLSESPSLAKGLAQELGGRARAGEVSAILGSRSVAERTETALTTDVQGDEFEKDIERKAARFVGSMNTLKANLGLFIQGTLFQSGILDEFGAALVKISEKFKAVAEVFINNQDTVEAWQPIIIGIAQAFLFMAINAGKAVTGIVAKLSKVGLTARSAVTDLMNMFDKPAENLMQRAASAGLAVVDEFDRMGVKSADLAQDFEKMSQRAGSAFEQMKQDAKAASQAVSSAQVPQANTGTTTGLNSGQASIQASLTRADREEQRIQRIITDTATPDDIRQMELNRRLASEAPEHAKYVPGAGIDRESDMQAAYMFNELGDVMNDYADTQREVQNETKQAAMETVAATRDEASSKKESSRSNRALAKETKSAAGGLRTMGSFLRGFTTRGVTGVPTFLQNNERLRGGLSTAADIVPMAALDLMIGGTGGENLTNIGAGIAGAFAGSLMGPMGTIIGYQIGQGTAEAIDLYGQIGTSEQEKSSVLRPLATEPQTEEEKTQIDTRIAANAAQFEQKYKVESTLDELARQSLSRGWNRPEATLDEARSMRAAGMMIDFDISSESVRKLQELEAAGEDISVNALNNTSFGLLGDVTKKELAAYEELKKNKELFDLYANADLSSLEDVTTLLEEAADPSTELGRQFLLMENQAADVADNINQVKVNTEELARLSEVAGSGGDVELFAPDVRGVYDVLADDQDLLDSFIAGGFESIQQALNDTTEAGKEFKRLWENKEQEQLYFGSLAQTLSEIDEKIARTRSSMQTMFSMPTGLGEFGAFGTQTLGLRNQYLPEVSQIASQPYASEDDQRTLESYQMGRESLMGLGEMESYMLPLAQELNQDLEGMRQILYEVGAEGQQAFASSIQPLIEMIQFTREYEAQLAAIRAIENDPSFAPGMEGYQEAAAKLSILKEETLERKSQYEYYRAYLDSVASSPEAFKKELESVRQITQARQVTQAQPTVIKGREAQFRAPSLVDVEGYSTDEIAQALEEARKKQEDMIRMFPQMAEEFRKEQFMLEAGDQYQGVTGVSQSYFQESLSDIREGRKEAPAPLQAPSNVDLSEYSDEEIQKIMTEARALQDQAVALVPDLADKYEDERLLIMKKNNQLLLETGLSQEYLQAAIEDNTEVTEEGLRGHYNLPGGYKPPTIWDYYDEGGTSTGDVNYVAPPGGEGKVTMDMATDIANAILEAETGGKDVDETVMPTLEGLDTMTPGAAPLGYPEPGTPDKIIPAPITELPAIEEIDLPEYPVREAEEQKSIIRRLSDKFLDMLPVTEVQESITARLSQKFTDMVGEAQSLALTTNATTGSVGDMGTSSSSASSSLVDLFGRTKDAGLSVTAMAQAAAGVNSIMSDSAMAMKDLPPATKDTTAGFNSVNTAMDTLAQQLSKLNIAQQLADVINRGAITVNIAVAEDRSAKVTATTGGRGSTGGGGQSTKAGSTTGHRPI